MKKLFFSIFIILLCVCVLSLVLTDKPFSFNSLFYLLNHSPSYRLSISSWVNSVAVPYIQSSWNFEIINLDPIRDFFNSCVTVVNYVWKPISFFFGGIRYVIQWWSFFVSYVFS